MQLLQMEHYAYSNRDVWEENDKKSIKTKAELDFKITRKIKSFGINYSCFGEYINLKERGFRNCLKK